MQLEESSSATGVSSETTRCVINFFGVGKRLLLVESYNIDLDIISFSSQRMQGHFQAETNQSPTCDVTVKGTSLSHAGTLQWLKYRSQRRISKPRPFRSVSLRRNDVVERRNYVKTFRVWAVHSNSKVSAVGCTTYRARTGYLVKQN